MLLEAPIEGKILWQAWEKTSSSLPMFHCHRSWQLMWNGGRRRSEWGTLGQIFSCANMSPAVHVTAVIWAGSELWPSMPHWTLTPSKKGSGNTSFKYKTPFWCLNIWHPLETIPKTYKNYIIIMLSPFSSLLGAFHICLCTMKRHERSQLTQIPSAECRKILMYVWRNKLSYALHLEE